MSALVAVITEMVTQTAVLEEQVKQGFGRHPDVEIYRSQPGLGTILGARVLAEMGDDPHRYTDARARKNYAGMAPITERPGRNGSCWPARPATDGWPTPSTSRRSAPSPASPGARAYYDRLRARDATHHQALRALGNRLVGILHGCLTRNTVYDETLAWPPTTNNSPLDSCSRGMS